MTESTEEQVAGWRKDPFRSQGMNVIGRFRVDCPRRACEGLVYILVALDEDRATTTRRRARTCIAANQRFEEKGAFRLRFIGKVGA